jgi:glycosyltransferase involved in cell wall biosynthesis
VVSLGRIWDAGKQVRLLLGHEHKIPISIIGSEQHPDESRRCEASSRSLRPNVTFYGAQPHPRLAGTLSRASIYAATSRYEPFGLAPLEAALSRCALVVNDIPSFHEIWSDAACYFATNDAQSLAECIDSLASDPGLRNEYAARAYERARQRYTANGMVNGYLDLYRTLLSRNAHCQQPVPAGVALQ